jgi:hypothetical protein
VQIPHSTPGTLVVVALLVTAGCQGLYGSSASPSDQRAVDAVDRAQEAALDVTSYRYTTDGQVQMRDDSRSRSVEQTGGGTVDVNQQRANVTVRIRGDTRVGLRETRMGHLDGYTFDVECSRLGWARYNLTESTRWLNYTPLGRQLALLDRTNVYWNGTETVDGVETAVVTAHPTERQLQTNRNLPPGTDVTQGGATVQNATVRVWINTETDRIHKARREIRVRGDGTTAVAATTFHFSEYNDPVNVTRPSFERSGSEWKGDCPET